jgi:hypothetical protein
MKKLYLFLMISLLSACGTGNTIPRVDPIPLPPMNKPSDEGIIRARAEIDVQMNCDSLAMHNFYKWFSLLPRAYAATGATTITYNNAGVIAFTLDQTNLAVSPSFSGVTLNLGSLVLSNIDDNTLKVCGVGGNSRCTQAVIRIYNTNAPADALPSTSTIAGFVNVDDAADLYGVPVYAGSLNPSTALPYGAAGSVVVQTVSIPGNKKRLRLADFGAVGTRTYDVSADFSNAGSGQYKMRLVVEYVLQ